MADFIRDICEGRSERFGEVECQYYDRSSKSRECRLLRELRMEEFWEACRIDALKRLYDIVETCNKRFRDTYQDIPIDEAEDFNFEGVVRRLKAIKLNFRLTRRTLEKLKNLNIPDKILEGLTSLKNKNFTNEHELLSALEKQLEKKQILKYGNLIVDHAQNNPRNLTEWNSYVNMAVYLEIKKNLRERGLLPGKKNCGSCKHLSKSSPYTCTKTGELKNKTDNPCDEDYSPDIGHFTSIDEKHSQSHEEYTQETHQVVYKISKTVKTPEEGLIKKEQSESWPLEEILDLLNALIEEAPPGSAERRNRRRQYEVFIHLTHVLQEVIDEMFAKESRTKTEKRAFNKKINVLRTEAIKRLAGKFCRRERTIKNDLKYIRDILRERGAIHF